MVIIMIHHANVSTVYMINMHDTASLPSSPKIRWYPPPPVVVVVVAVAVAVEVAVAVAVVVVVLVHREFEIYMS